MPVWIATIAALWIGLNPALRLWVYPMLSLKSFIEVMDFVSGAILVLEGLSLWVLYGYPQKLSIKAEAFRNLKAWAAAFLLFPLFWVAISFLLFILIDWGILEDAGIGPLYDGLLYTRSHPISWTSFSFMASAVTEEIFFRAWLPDFLERSMRRSFSIVLSALAFAFAHYSQHMAPLAFTLYVLVSLSLSYVRTRYGIRAAIGLHLGNNLLAFLSTVLGWNALTLILEDPMLSRTALVISAGGLLLVLNDLRKIVDRKPYSLP